MPFQQWPELKNRWQTQTQKQLNKNHGKCSSTYNYYLHSDKDKIAGIISGVHYLVILEFSLHVVE